jgi:glycerate-2-kinase
LLKKLREDALTLLYDGISAASPNNLFSNNLVLQNNVLTISDIYDKSESFELDNYNRLIVIGSGKASTSMAFELEKVLGDKINDGLVITKYNFKSNLNKIQMLEAGHPLPDENGIQASRKIIDICNDANEKDLIINLVSGGASALLPCPADNITLEDKVKTTSLLLKSGVSIQEINTVRKHISVIKGGQLARYAYPARVINIIISDVIGDVLDSIGSGIMIPDSTTFEDCWKIIINNSLEDKIPYSVKLYVQNGIGEKNRETPKPGDQIFKNVHSFIIGNNKTALSAIKSSAEEKGYNTKIISTSIQGKARVAGKEIVHSVMKYILQRSNPYCFILGGETEVVIKGKGKGGRNQELCLSVAIEINGVKNAVFLSAGTDGNDGTTEAAGAICDGSTIERAEKIGLDAKSFLENNDSFNFFKKLNDLIITGPTKTNVMDIQLFLINHM